jgi:GTP diphosphokinase / guanosine-3',5'-bis(diphosphate) 3'-diphosphatase
MITYQDLVDAVQKSHHHADMALIEHAYRFADEAHEGLFRKSGEPYIVHPLATAIVLAEMQLDSESIVAGLLHDVPEDTPRTLDDVQREFGPTIARIVDGVTKLGQIRWPTPEEQAAHQAEVQAENLRKMFLAMVDDVRVVLVKLADRLHNMRTLSALPPHKQQRIAKETMEIYAPLANRLGIWQIKSELEDIAFRYLEPERYTEIARLVASQGGSRERMMAKVKADLSARLEAQGITADISGRSKHIYSIARKMERKGGSIDRVFDVVGLRVICQEVRDCYAVLGEVHTLWRPVPGEFDDYIATPKESFYRSLHTAVMVDGRPLEIQIRTWEMHRESEFGIAAHWRYKEGSRTNASFDSKIAWLRQLLEWRDEAVDAQTFVDNLKTDIFQDLIYVFTPKGDIFELPAGATPIDFAFRIHTDVGYQCVGAKVNDALVPLDYRLQNGQVVQVITSKNRAGPSRDWLNPSLGFIKTGNAREKVRQWFRRQERDSNIAEGRAMLEKELKRLGLEVSFEEVFKHFPRYTRLDDFLAAIGYGAVSLQAITAKVAEVTEEPHLPAVQPAQPARTVTGLSVQGVGDLLTNLARCCKPMPGDEIIGFITRGKGITVHRVDCPNIRHEPEKERIIGVSWGNHRQEVYPVTIRVEAWDRVGLLRDISTIVADEKVNMTSVLTTTHPDHTVALLLTIQVSNVRQLSRLLARIEAVRDVYEVRRDVPGGAATVTSSTAPAD